MERVDDERDIREAIVRLEMLAEQSDYETACKLIRAAGYLREQLYGGNLR